MNLVNYFLEIAEFTNRAGVHELDLPVTETHVLAKGDSIFKINVFLAKGKACYMWKG